MPPARETPTGTSRRRLVALVLALTTIPFAVGAAAPLALRPVVDAPATQAAPDLQLPRPTAPSDARAETGRPSGADGVVHQSERLERRTAAGPEPVRQSARVVDAPPPRGERRLAAPTLRPGDAGWVARRLEIPALGVNVAVAMAPDASAEDFPPFDGAYILRSSAQPGRGTNSYLFAHAMPNLFKPLWWAQVGQQVVVTMSDGQQLGYRITRIVRDIPCPDPTVPKPAGLPPVLANATECDLQWTLPTATERLTMQTSQGFNRNYGEMVVIAEPDW